jgi:hypothetical protein
MCCIQSGLEIAPNELWMVIVGQQCLALGLVYGVFRAYKNGMRPHPTLKLSPVGNGQDSMHRAQVVMHRGQFAAGVPGPMPPIPCFGPTVLQHPAQFIMKFPQAAWSVDRTLNCIHVDARYYPMISQWNQHAPTLWSRIKSRSN